MRIILSVFLLSTFMIGCTSTQCAKDIDSIKSQVTEINNNIKDHLI
jgi:hypothetical protein